LYAFYPPKLSENKYTSDNGGIPYTIANFGNIPYGKTMIGVVKLAEPEDACTTLRPIDLGSGSPFILIKRGGGCSFVTKVKNAEFAGAKLAIIAD